MGSRARPLGAAEEAEGLVEAQTWETRSPAQSPNHAGVLPAWVGAGSKARPPEAVARAEGLEVQAEPRPLEAAEEAASKAQLPAEAAEVCK